MGDIAINPWSEIAGTVLIAGIVSLFASLAMSMIASELSWGSRREFSDEFWRMAKFTYPLILVGVAIGSFISWKAEEWDCRHDRRSEQCRTEDKRIVVHVDDRRTNR